MDITDLRKEEDDLSNAAKQSFWEYGIILATRERGKWHFEGQKTELNTSLRV